MHIIPTASRTYYQCSISGLYMMRPLIKICSRGCWNNVHQLLKNNVLFVRQSKYRKIHHPFCHKYGVTAYWFILDHSVKQKPKF